MSELNDVLVDVRKAYRLIYLYQQRIFSIVEVFSEKLNLNYYYWIPSLFTKPSSANPFNRWTWDMLPMYKVSFLYLHNSNRGDNSNLLQGDLMVEFQIDSDSGYLKDGGKEPNPLSFDDVEESKSYLNIYFWYANTDMKKNWYHNIWNVYNYPNEKNEIVKIDNLKIAHIEIDLIELENEEKILEYSKILKKFMKDNFQIK